MSEDLIRLENISYSYEKYKALDKVSLSFEKKCYVIQGPNGCGKSTLFRILTGLSFPSGGHYYFKGEEVNEKYLKSDRNRMKFHKAIGFVFQDPEVQLFTRSVEDEIAFGLFQLDKDPSEIRETVDKYIKMLNLENVRERAPFNLSGGEKKRVALAAILAMDPEILILDEPLNGLDEDGQNFVTSLLFKLKSTGRLIILSSHNSAFSEKIADTHILMNKDHRISEIL